jgi:hypothetical protein
MLYFIAGTGGMKQMGTRNAAENGRGARVALCAHPSHTDTDNE